MRQDIAALKAMKRCIYCRTNKADEGYYSCLQCRMDQREIARRKPRSRSEESRLRHKKRQKRYRDLQYAFGVCIKCGKRDAKPGRHCCGVCLAKARKRSEIKRVAAGITPRDSYTLQGKCYFCGNPAIEGKKTCKIHYETRRTNMLYARSMRKSDYFKGLNNLFFLSKSQKNKV